MSEEEWLICSAFPKYEVSSLGRVRNRRSGYIKKPTIFRGYPLVNMVSKDGKRVLKVARLVMHAFERFILDEGYVIRYHDKNRLNTAYENLYYGTRKSVIQDAWNDGKMKNRSNDEMAKNFKRRDITDYQKQSAILLMGQGHSKMSIAKALGVSKTYLYLLGRKQSK